MINFECCFSFVCVIFVYLKGLEIPKETETSIAGDDDDSMSGRLRIDESDPEDISHNDSNLNAVGNLNVGGNSADKGNYLF